MANPSGEVIEKTVITTIMWIIVIGVISLIFVLATMFMIRWRHVQLGKYVKMIPRNELRTSKKDLDGMYKRNSKIWEKRYSIAPIPEKNHVSNGYIRAQDGSVFNVREEIIKSFKIIEKTLNKYSEIYPRKKSQTPQQYFRMLRHFKDSQLKKSDSEKYLSYYQAAKYGSYSIGFDSQTWTEFSQCFALIMSQIKEFESSSSASECMEASESISSFSSD